MLRTIRLKLWYILFALALTVIALFTIPSSHPPLSIGESALIRTAFWVVETFPDLFLTDEEIQEGSGYGFTIGMLKEEAINTLVQDYENSFGISEEKLRSGEFHKTTSFVKNEEQLDLLRGSNLWTLYYWTHEKETWRNVSNYLELEFVNDRLAKIRRYNRKAELP